MQYIFHNDKYNRFWFSVKGAVSKRGKVRKCDGFWIIELKTDCLPRPNERYVHAHQCDVLVSGFVSICERCNKYEIRNVLDIIFFLISQH